MFPGLTRYFAPAFTAASISAGFVTVPTPTIAPGTFCDMSLIASIAAFVRKVTSMAASPPASKACASGTAFFASSMVKTGTTGIFAKSGSGSGTAMEGSDVSMRLRRTLA